MISEMYFKPSKQIKIKEGFTMMESKHKGKFTRQELEKTLQHIATESNSKGHADFRMGVAFHYKKNGLWAPAVFRNANQAQVVWDPKDSPDSMDLYTDDSIDEAIFWVANNTKVTEAEKVLDYRKPRNKKLVIKKSDFVDDDE